MDIKAAEALAVSLAAEFKLQCSFCPAAAEGELHVTLGTGQRISLPVCVEDAKVAFERNMKNFSIE